MNFAVVKETAKTLFAEASFISQIRDEAEYEQALALMDELVEDYDEHEALIEILAQSIAKWEDTSPDFAEFNQQIDELDTGVALLRTLMDQYQLKADDLKNEIGGKSLVSMILNGSRNLTREHIEALATRFGISPALFFERQPPKLHIAQ